jgi:hypothetical protein
MPLWAWLVLFALEGVILVVYFRDEIRLRAFQRRFALVKEGKGFRGTVAGRAALLPNLRSVDEDPDLRILVPVAIGRLRQVAAPGTDFGATFELEATPDVRWGVWSEDAEQQALALAHHGTLASAGASDAGRAELSIKVPRTVRFQDGPRALESLAALANHLAARDAQLEQALRADLGRPHPRGLGALEGLMHRGWARASEIESMLVALVRGDDGTLRERAARIADRYEVPLSVTEAVASQAPREGAWRDPSIAGLVARAVVRLGRLTEIDAIRWLGGPEPVVAVALEYLGSTGGMVAYQAVRASLERAMTKELRNRTREALAKLRARHPALGEGQLALSAPEGGEIAEVADAGAVALAEENE